MNRSRYFLLLICLILLFTLTVPAYAAHSQSIAVDPINVMVGGKIFLPTDVNGKNVPVFVYQGTTYAPLRALAEAYGLTVSYHAEKQLAAVSGTPSGHFEGTKGTAQALSRPTTLSVSSINIEVNGEVFLPKDVTGAPVAVFLYNGTTYAPLRALAEAYGLTVGYDAEKQLATVDFAPALSTSFEEISAAISAQHQALIRSATSFQDIAQYLVSDTSSAALLSSDEVRALVSYREPKNTLSYAEAAADVDLFFRAFASAYGGYYYFGQNAFQEAKAEIMAWLSGRSVIYRTDFESALADAMDFLQDAHVSIGGVDRGLDLEYEYFYCEGQNYLSDGKVYYKDVDGEMWHFVSFSDPRVTMERSLTAEGEIVYSPVLLCPEPDMASSTVTLKNASGKTKTETLRWLRNESYWGGYFGEVDYQLLEEGGIAYLSLRSCNSYFDTTLQEYAASGAEVRDASLIIFDLRGNGGGSELYSMDWIMNFVGYSPALPLAGGTRYSALRTATGFDSGHIPAGTFESYQVAGRWIENDIPIIVLVDEYVASAGESTLNYLRSMDNVVVVGSNSTGAQLCGNIMDLFLPHSGIRFRFGSGLGFQYDSSNKDFRGYAPDIWCSPKNSLDAVMKMAERYHIAKNTSGMNSALDQIITSKANITLYLVRDPNTGAFHQPDPELYPGQRCGMPQIDASQCWMVYKDGQPRSDYTVWSANPDICKTTRLDSAYNGAIFEARTMSHGSCKFYITVDGETAEFIWFAG